MALQDFIEKSRERYQEQGFPVIPSIAGDLAVSAVGKFPLISQVGTNIFEREWDVLLILDACRLDMYRDQINAESDSIWSVGSSSNEWMQHTFTESWRSEIGQTTYVTGNPFSDEECPRDLFREVDEVWRYAWDSDAGTIYPEPITDRVINYHRNGRKRVIGHYMQPHYPFLDSKVKNDEMTWEVIGDEDENLGLWTQFMYSLRDDFDEVKRAYDRNLQFVWEEVQTVLNNVDGRVVVTADHGNALGEWGVWGHQPGFPHPQMRRVPWDEYDCEDSGNYAPSVGSEKESKETVENRLNALGYK